MDKRKYRVLPDNRHGGRDEYGPGDIVELTADEAGPLLGWRLEAVEEVKQSEPKPEPTGKRKEKAQ